VGGRRARLAVVLACLIVASCAGQPHYDRLPEGALTAVEGGFVIDDWPVPTVRRYDGDTAGGMPPRFHDRVEMRGLSQPTALRFGTDGRVYIAQQSGIVMSYAATDGSDPRRVVDFRDRVFNFREMGLLGIALDPAFDERPYLYLLYTHDAPIGGQAPTYGEGLEDADHCPGYPEVRCIVSGRLSRVMIEPGGGAGAEQVLIEDWCHDGPHSIGTVLFGPDGGLYAGAGDNTGGMVAEYGQSGDPPNPCGDPPGPVGHPPDPATAQGGSLRSQDLRTRDDPTGLAGTIIRVDPDTGAPLADNPLAGDAEENVRRIVAYGLRNPYRFAFRPGSSEIWIADVGWFGYEEINVVDDPLAGPVPNFGWPCYEGPLPQAEFVNLGVGLCEALYEDRRDLVMPRLSLPHTRHDEGPCTGTGNVLSALAFYDGETFPLEYEGALFFADTNRACIWVARAGDDGQPDLFTLRHFRTRARAVDLQVGPDGALYYLDYGAGALRRIQHYAANQPPRARLRTTAEAGPAPLTVTINATRSTDADGDPLSYAWDTDEDFIFDDGTADRVTLTFTEPGRPVIRVRVTDSHGEWAEAQIRITVEPASP
jgi:glucose/arabinose dehydrogenase